MKTINAVLLTTLISATILFYACSKEKSDSGSQNGTTQLKISMTDAPVQADSVNVEIREVKVNFRNDSTQGWLSLSTNAGIYNLLGLQNGIDTLLAVATVPTDTLRQIRFVLGTNNSIVVNGIRYPLTIPSGAESGLKINVSKKLNANFDSLLIDFDAGLSIHQTGNGVYMLRPVLRVK